MKCYKKLLFCVCVFTLSFLATIPAIANTNASVKISEDGGRVYLQPSEIVINPHGIFFCVEGEFFKTEILNHDENGFNVPLAPMYWICKNGHINPLYRYPCGKCGAGAPGT